MSDTSLVPASNQPPVKPYRSHYQRPPKWLDDPAKRTRVAGIYKDYLRCLSIPEIITKWKVSPGTVYRDIERARNEAVRRWANSLAGLLAERIEVRYEIVREIDEALARLRKSKVQGDKRARAEKELLSLKSDQHKEVDFLTGFKGKTEASPWKNGDPGRLGAQHRIAVIVGSAGLKATLTLEEDNPEPEVLEGQFTAHDMDDEEEDDD